ncbi:NosD domain-containing protein [Romboutsia lituseburensis]|uniref:NosD domain-containing protein n=1 Tax=Romboutsia lituseburensis TaxID=1537 RepID=UPI00215A9E2B|nr:hypothetical protein [Romboutsia lituseburensis]MCR8747084.1 hypothetical protein [Romboutsia lituseburensis]
MNNDHTLSNPTIDISSYSFMSKPIGTSKDNIICLTEDGFSKPIGTFDKSNRIAELTTSLKDKILIINMSNFDLLGNNYSIQSDFSETLIFICENLQNIVIDSIDFISNSTCIELFKSNKNITIKNCNFTNSKIGLLSLESENLTICNNSFFNIHHGITLVGCNNTCINCNSFFENIIATYLYKSNINTNIITNIYNDCIEGITLYKDNNLNKIYKNTFKSNILFSMNFGIRLFYGNGYNIISENLIIHNNSIIKKSEDNNKLYFIGIYFENNFNILNEISNNKIIVKNNNYELKGSSSIDVRLYGIAIFSDHSQIEIFNNHIAISNNKFNILGSEKQNVLITNIFMKNNYKNRIYSNTCHTIKNKILFSENNISVLISSINIDKQNSSLIIKNNQLFILKNILIPSANQNIFYSLIISPIIVCLENTNIDIINNNIEMNFNTLGINSAIFVNKSNFGINVLNNFVSNLDGHAIVLNEDNIANTVQYNRLENITGLGICLLNSNHSNIIKDNFMKNIKSTSLLLSIYNLSNIISNNYFENNYRSIYILPFNNQYNTINYNKFNNNNNNLLVSSNLNNYIFENLVKLKNDNLKVYDS